MREVFEIKLKTKPKKKDSDDDERIKSSVRRLASNDILEDEQHYDISEARELMEKNFNRRGDARYAVKYLHEDLDKLEDARGKIDLAIEAKYLSVVSHPNIIKMRGVAACNPLDDEFFIILDRLYDTLEEKMGKWKVIKKKAKGRLGMIGGLGSNKDALQELMMDRLLVGYDLSSAFRYLHENR